MELRVLLLVAFGCSGCLFVYSTSDETGAGASSGAGDMGGSNAGASDQGGAGALATFRLSGPGFAVAVDPSRGAVVLTGTSEPNTLEYLAEDGQTTLVSAPAALASSVVWSGADTLSPREVVTAAQHPILRCDMHACVDWSRTEDANAYVALTSSEAGIVALGEDGVDIFEPNGDLAQHLDGGGEGAAVAFGRCDDNLRIAWTTRTRTGTGSVWVADSTEVNFGEPASTQVELKPGSVSVAPDCAVYFAAADSATSSYFRLASGNATPMPLPLSGPLEAHLATSATHLFATTLDDAFEVTVAACSLADPEACQLAPVGCSSVGGLAVSEGQVWFSCDVRLVRWTPE